MTASIKCKKCSGRGGSIWHEVDGSERGEVCDVCDGIGIFEAEAASELVKRAREFVSEAMVENGDPMFAKAVLAGQYDNGVSVKAVCKVLALMHAEVLKRQWLPIDTDAEGNPLNVPIDTPILVPPTKRLDMTVAKWTSRDGWETEAVSEWVGIYRPTHWMPLPEWKEPQP